MNIQERIERALDQIRPALRMDGGNVEFVAYDPASKVLKLRMVGACDGCSMSSMTLKMGIERAVRQSVPEVRTVEAI